MTHPSLRALIIGHPVQHARSPLVHQHWLGEYGIDGRYDRLDVPPGAVAETLQKLQSEGYRGCNVTVPHKEEAFLACNQTTDRACQIRAVNTIWFENGIVCGDNTDGLGFTAHLDQTYPDWARSRPNIFILGAGGGARGLLLPLLSALPETILISNRSADRAEDLIREVEPIAGPTKLIRVDWSAKNQHLERIDLLINTTSLGMVHQPPLEIDLAGLPPHAIVADIVYVPLETALLKAARARGLKALDGLGMLLHQAVPGFERWFGRKPVVSEALRAKIVADLVRKA